MNIMNVFYKIIAKLIKMPANQFHPLVYIGGQPEFGKNVYIGLFSEVNAQESLVKIGDNCDIASFVSINVADSHKKAVGLAKEIERRKIAIDNDVFIGSHCFIGGGVHIGHHTVVAAGTIITKPCEIPPYSLVIGNPPVIKEGYYKNDSSQ
ncbi:MAG: acyltransferase [Candidatus Harrisonbacteria bacterium]|nr:acyltransferase [Candidatus Harrisonbacteria bacterium]